MNDLKKCFILFVTFVFFSCTPAKTVEVIAEDVEKDIKKEVAEIQPNCKVSGKVIDQSNLDGCRLLIVLEDGQRLEPVSMVDKSFKLKAGQNIRLSYEQEKEMMSVCMGGMLVKITCIEEIKK